MPLQKRYLTPSIIEDLSNQKMVFLGGPRQVGKTTLSEDGVGTHFKYAYFNWDKISQRQRALKSEWPAEAKLLILDEFHKHRKWKSWIKGEYDSLKNRYKFLLTGSARLNIFRRGGDSLHGRYHFYRLHPFSLAEMIPQLPQQKPMHPLAIPSLNTGGLFPLLLKFGGFPEPFLKQEERHLRRWQIQRMEKILEEDVRDLTLIQDLGNLSLLADLLPERASKILSINSLAEDLQVNFRTVSNWLSVFEQLYYCFRVLPYQSKKIASVRKEKKLYLWDWSSIPDEGGRLENLVASHLLKYCHYLHDVEGWRAELFYLRDSTAREVDFLVCINNKPWFAVEVKSREKQISRHLQYFRTKLKIPYCYQIVGFSDADFEKEDIRLLPASKFLTCFC